MMGRDIKFRAWDSERNRMYSDIQQTYDGRNNIPMDCFGNFLLDVYKDRFSVMQYTGLHDKNGKDIYEGDIVTSTNGLVGKIIFENGAYVIDYDDEGLINTTLYSLNRYDRGITEIIGNRFENPEMLEEGE